MKNPIKLAIADDDAIYRAILLAYIKPFKDIEVILQAGNGRELIDLLQQNQEPDIVLLDLEMPIMDGRETLDYLSKEYPNLKVLILTVHNDDEMFCYLIEKGANSFIPKEIGLALIIEAVYAVKAIGYYFANVDLKKIMAAKKPAKPDSGSIDMIPFTKRETEIIRLICQGYSNKDISEKLFISQRTVDAHKNNMVQKANVGNMTGLMAFIIKNNLHWQ